MICKYCGEELQPVDTVESPITGAMVDTGYACPNRCELLKYLEGSELYVGK